ncbi:hypothetical protein Smp_132530 [Schistosoma mansoni]|uniref:hypothetical protein n=1 Tax=Schistosoma mansoni TaxID=6183 RepID=UPI0001A642E3|nr:hypothetical protein Smp_132530 [Schistosoma mansoni]|eukprot:XP_018651485.1 hypothetical protein Smp_132530 [Schistosoma mansoni]
MGNGFYLITPISILLSQSNAAERSYLVIGLFTVHMLILQYLQDLVFRQLAALRSGKNENTEFIEIVSSDTNVRRGND